MGKGVALRLQEMAESLEAHRGYDRLLLLAGPHGSGKTAVLRALCAATEWSYVNLNLELSGRLLDVATRFREIEALNLARAIADEAPGPILVIDNIELLFEPRLKQDPLRVLLALARSRTVIASWPGEFACSTLLYTAPGHPEYRRYHRPSCGVLSIADSSTSSPGLGIQ